MYYQIEPEVAGGWGEGTEADTTCHPPVVTKLTYEFEGWLGDSIVESFPCFIITEKLAGSIIQSDLSGYKLSECEISTTATFIEFYPDLVLPKFVWLKINGQAGNDDFGINTTQELVLSEKALQTLKNHSLNNCDIERYDV